MPTFKVHAGFRIDDLTCARLQQQGISQELFTQVVRIIGIERTGTDTVFIIDASTEELAEEWRPYIIQDITSMEPYEVPVVTDPDPPPDPLDVWCEVGQWTKSVGVTPTTISGLPSEPKGVILWGSGLSAAVFGTYSEAGAVILGYSDGTTHRSYGFACQDNVATSNSNRAIQTKAFHLVDPTGGQTTHIKEGCTIDFDATSFDMDWDATTLATTGNYFVFGGDDIADVQVKDFEYGTTTTGSKTYTGLGDEYDFGLFLNPFAAGPLPWSNSGLLSAMHGISCHAGTNNQRTWTNSIRHQDNVSPSSCHRLQKRTRMLSTMSSSSNTEQQFARFDGWNSDGFTLEWINPPSTATDIFSGFFVKGGKWDAGHFYQPVTATTIRTLLLDKFAVIQGIMGFSVNQNDATFDIAGTTPAKLCIGAEDAAGNRGNIVYAGVHANNPTIEATVMLNNKFIRSIDANATASSSTTTSECTVSDIATAGEFTCDFTTADAIVRQIVWFTLSG